MANNDKGQNLISKYVWVIDTIYRRRKISFKELNERWIRDTDISRGLDIPPKKPQNITMHIGNAYKEGELEKESTCKEYLQVQQEGKRKVSRVVRLILKKGLTESLAGRFELIRIGHWSYQEMHDAFGWDVDKYIYYGGYPGAAAFVDNEKRWKRYVKDSLVTPSIDNDMYEVKT